MMLRSTRPLLSNSSRAVVSQKATISSLRRPSFQFSDPTRLGRRVAPAPTRLNPLAPRTWIASSSKPPPRIQSERDPEEEKRFGQQKLASDPQAVSTQSSVRHLFEPDDPKTEAEKPVSSSLQDELDIVKDAFRLNTVPKESYALGLAGTLPFFGTSLSTLYLSWVLNTEWPTQSQFVNGLLVSHEQAQHWLGVLEPLQLGYGAVIISFLGAIHWGLEYAERSPSPERTRFRYGLGVLAPAVAWPTLLMPVEFALTTQFAAFIAIYWADTTAARRGWAPSWYATYRFVLTAIAGAAIALSLIGRAKVGDAKPRLSGLDQKIHEKHYGEQEYDEKWEKREAEEKKRIKQQKEEEERRQKKKKEEEENKKKDGQKKEDKKGEERKDGGDKQQSKDQDKGQDQDKGSGKGKETEPDDSQKGGDDKGGDGKKEEQ